MNAHVHVVQCTWGMASLCMYNVSVLGMIFSVMFSLLNVTVYMFNFKYTHAHVHDVHIGLATMN